mgnify:CR=1 FL=1
MSSYELLMSASVQITPAYPPDISGVGDYSALLSNKFRERGGSMWTLVARQGMPDVAPMDEAVYLSEMEAERLAQAIDGYDRVLLHFSGYGYARRGLCRWVVDGLARWKARGNGRRLVTMFHEVYATGPIWRSSFWTAAPQKRIARDLAMLSDAGFVSSQGGQDQLARLAPGLPVQLLPVFSNVGEPEAPCALFDRLPVAVVFGGRTRRRRVYDALARLEPSLSRALNHIGVSQIVDIGPEMQMPGEVDGCPVTALGEVSSTEVSAALLGARIGFVDYPGHVFTKSGIVAAYFAHRLTVVNTSPIGGFPADLVEGENFESIQRFVQEKVEHQAIADAGHQWYRLHNSDVTAEKIRAVLS